MLSAAENIENKVFVKNVFRKNNETEIGYFS
jgi:hypothetical protein